MFISNTCEVNILDSNKTVIYGYCTINFYSYTKCILKKKIKVYGEYDNIVNKISHLIKFLARKFFLWQYIHIVIYGKTDKCTQAPKTWIHFYLRNNTLIYTHTHIYI